MMVGIFSIMAMYFADSYFIAQLGVRPLAAVGFTLPMINVLSALAFGFGAAGSSLISRAYNQKDQSQLSFMATQTLAIALVHALVFAVLGLMFAGHIFTWMGASEALLEEILAYANVWFYGCFLVIVPMVGNSIIRATGNTRLPGYVMFSIALVNIVLDPIFIFGWWIIPPMGIRGAAVATLLAYSVAFFLALYVLFARLKMLRLSALRSNPLRVWRSLLHIAYPSVLTNLMVPISIAITTAFIAHYGEAAVAGLSVALRIESFALVPVFGLASVMSPFAGQNMGAGREDRMREALRWTNKVMLAYGACIYLLLFFLGESIVAIFDITPAVKEEAITFLQYVGWSYGLLGIAVVTNSSANALARPLIALVINLGRLFLIYLPLLWLLEVLIQTTGIYLSMSLATLFTALVAIYLRRYLFDGR